MDIRMAKHENDDGSYEVYFVGLKHWDEFDMLLKFLEEDYGCEILLNIGAVYLRKAELLCNDTHFILMYDDMLGNYFYTEDATLVPFLEQLAQDVINSIKQKLREKGPS